ncbi:MAG: hypothetical protein HYY51_04450 [Candidatus Magasanikbacteria bacterium]|nr:hypothetical protein [Candidatus Magasanikbacteria bacterium]
MFKLWSEIKKEAKGELSPDFGFRNWADLSSDDKYLIWKYLEWHFFSKDELNQDFSYGNRSCNYKFFGDYDEKDNKLTRVVDSIQFINLKYKAKSYARNFLEDGRFNSACHDFYKIFSTQSENVVLELLSLYSKLIILERNDREPGRNENENDDEFKKRTFEWRWEVFEKFAEDLNEVFIQFGIKYYLTRDSFVPRQDIKIMKEIYEPVLIYLSDNKWKGVNSLLGDSFNEYRKNTPQGYSNSVTNTISAIQAFLQILNNGETGKGNISQLIVEAQKKGLIDDDSFTKKIFDNVESIFAKERQETSTAHPKKEYATEKNARTMLNLAMIFFQHCIQK